jgi:hypothetical protein
MKILSFDVGVKNLALIILEIQNEYLEEIQNKENTKSLSNINTEKILIKDWKIINLLEEFNEVKDCIFIDKKKRKKDKEIIEKNCDKNATCSFNGNEYCNKHFKNIVKDYEYDKIFIKLEDEENEKCSNKKCKTKKIETKYTVNKDVSFMENYELKDNKLYLCKTHTKSILKNHKNFVKKNNFGSKNFNNTKIDEIKLNLWLKLDKIPELLEVDYVIIENQPVLKNPRMKTISESLYNYFLCRGVVDKERTKSSIEVIRYINPSNKLKLEKDNSIEILKNSGEKKYKMTKNLAVEYTKNLLESYPNYKDYFNNFKKKDDLADCFLQGLYYIYFIHK